MTKTEEQMRAEFECWYSHNGESDVAIQRTESGSYYLMQAQAAWMAWQACQRQNDAEIARLTHQVESLMNLCRSKNESIIDITTQRDAEIERLRESLENIANNSTIGGDYEVKSWAANIATKALEGGKDE